MTQPTDPQQQADARADQRAREAAGAAAAPGPELSDAGAAIAYPDFDSPGESQPISDADAEPIPPFEQRPGALMDILRSAHTNWPAAREALINFKYAPPTPRSDAPWRSPQWYHDVDASGGPSEPDTYDQVITARDVGLLTPEQFTEVNSAINARSKTAPRPPDPPDGQDGIAGADADARQEQLTAGRDPSQTGLAETTPADLGV